MSRPPGQPPSWIPADAWARAVRPELEQLVDALVEPAREAYLTAAARADDHTQGIRAVVALVVNTLQPADPPSSYHGAGVAVDVAAGLDPAGGDPVVVLREPAGGIRVALPPAPAVDMGEAVADAYRKIRDRPAYDCPYCSPPAGAKHTPDCPLGRLGRPV